MDELPRLQSVRSIRFVLRDDHALRVHEEALVRAILVRAIEARMTGYP